MPRRKPAAADPGPPPPPPPNPLADVPEEALRAELARRETERERAAYQARLQHGTWVRTHLDVLLELTPDHTWASCSDTDHRRPLHECPRCFLLDVRDSHWMDPDYQLKLLIEHDELTNPDQPVR